MSSTPLQNSGRASAFLSHLSPSHVLTLASARTSGANEERPLAAARPELNWKPSTSSDLGRAGSASRSSKARMVVDQVRHCGIREKKGAHQKENVSFHSSRHHVLRLASSRTSGLKKRGRSACSDPRRKWVLPVMEVPFRIESRNDGGAPSPAL